MKDIWYILKFIKPYKTSVFGLLLFLLFYNLLSTALPYFTFTVIIDDFLPNYDFKSINFMVALIFLVVIILAFIDFIVGYIMSYMGSMVSFDIRNYLLRHLQSLSLKFYSDRNSGEILERLNMDVAAIQGILTNELVSFVTNISKFLFLTVAIFYINPILATPMFIMILIQAIVVFFAIRQMHKDIILTREKESKLIGYLQERVTLVKVIQVFVRRKYEEMIHGYKSDKIIDQAMKVASVRSQLRATTMFIRNLTPIVVLWVGSYLIIVDKLTIGALIAMWMYSKQYMFPVFRMVMSLNRFQESVVGIQRVKAYLDEEPEVKEADNPIKKAKITGDIKFDNVDFSYEENKQVLFDIDLHIKAGETVAFVGESGSGKSTITNLIFRFYDPTKGEIMIDNKPLKNYSLRLLRKNIGVVFQETDMFVATLRDNLAYGATKRVSDAEIMKAVKMSLLEELVAKLPDGLDTKVEEKGKNFSGGEKQRISICRLILRNPKIVIFDEATSALDSKAESMIQETMNTVMQGPTSIIIAHRLSTVIDADRIFVFGNGRIIEVGTHNELISKGAEYKRLWDEQLKVHNHHEENDEEEK
ncbi:MAG: ABC transporter ATP-binding protein [Candidatus Delongbacteria bacterium]|jgi:ABC-type multidrug transport system fused ATPase/permease subunit|nr:ABC transporter ATP-binding protein [Candidatus Delongbacteria bacterium]